MSNDILLIDDEEKFAAMLQDLLSKHGYRAEYTLNPEHALDRLREKDFGLVVSDYKMPEMDGADFLVEARKVSPDLPVIMVSGLMNMPELIKVANIGVTLALEKPFDTDDFLEHVARFVQPEEGSVAEEEGPALSYPSPTTAMADESTAARGLLETLWGNANQYRHLFVEAAPKAETETLMREILGWLGVSPETSAPCMSIFDTETAFTRDWLENQDPFPPLMVLDLRGDPSSDRILSLTGEWISHVEGLSRDLSASRLLYLLPRSFPFSVDELGITEETRSLVAPSTPVLPPLGERVADVAAYLRRAFSVEYLSEMAEAEREFLLQYSWPGGHEEIRHRAKQMQDAGVAGVPGMREMLGSEKEGGAEIPSDTGLAAFLKRRQREFLANHRRGGESWEDLLQRLGLPANAVSEDEVRRDKVLFFPEILQPGEAARQ